MIRLSMSTEQEQNMKALELIKGRQESEANLNWSRNSYFLVVMSLLTLAYTQKPVDNALQLTIYQSLIAGIGVFLSIIWLLIQHRSSQYISYYKTEAQRLAKLTNTPDLYPPSLKGFEMRKLVYFLPIAFLVVLSALIGLQIYFYYYPLA
jgi:hypothetical protein